MPIKYIFLANAILLSLIQITPTTSSSIKLSVLPQLNHNRFSNNYRLTRDIIPKSYTITITPDMESESFAFTGEVKIEIFFNKSTSNITMHSKYLASEFINLTCLSEHNVKYLKTYINTKQSTITLNFNDTIKEKSICNLTMNYAGRDGENRGFYRTSYTNKNGKKQWMASTHLEPISAREVFPCWDEPSFKANFSIIIVHDRKFVVLSNMPEIQFTSINSTFRRTEFGQSPIMSTYLVAFAIGDFMAVDNDNQDFQVWTRRDVSNDGIYAKEIGRKILESFENYTNVSYETPYFPKLDSLAVPEIQADAMENWGLVIYKESKLLYSENSSSMLKKEDVAAIIAHELAHQWFGNLVTPDWWDDIWLNKGFANYFQYFIIDKIEPKWRMMDKFVVENVQEIALVADSENNNHAIIEIIETDKTIISSFNNITYSKSGAIIRMISHVLGEKVFQTALQNYIKKYAHKSVSSSDLFRELVKADNKTEKLIQILRNWFTVPGYPVIDVKRNETGEIIITQSRFFDNMNVTSEDTYWIPINFATEENLDFNDTTVDYWFHPSMDSITINSSKNSTFVILNKQQFGFYRVNYDEANWNSIKEYMKTNHTNIHVLNRAQLIDDAFNLAKAGHLKYSIALALIEYLKFETDFAPWSAAWRGIEYITKFVANTDFALPFKNYVLELSENLLREVQNIQLNETDHILKFKRIQTLKSVCTLGLQSCQFAATEKLVKWLNNSVENAFLPEEKEWIMCAGVRNATQLTWNKLWEKYSNEHNKILLPVLGCTSNANILDEYINRIMNENKTENLSEIFKAIYTGSDEGVNVVLNYMTKNYQIIIKLSGYSNEQFIFDLTSLAERITNEKQYEKLQQFNNTTDLNGTIDDVLRSVQINLEVNKKRLNQFQTYFHKDKPINPNKSTKNYSLSISAIIISLLFSQIY